MQLSNYSKEYIKEQMDDFEDFVAAVHMNSEFTKYSTDAIATLYTVMKREIPRENNGYSGY